MLTSILRASGMTLRANENISEALEPGDLARIEIDVAGAVRGLLDALAIDYENDHNTRDTPERVARMMVHEVFAGRYQPRPASTSFANVHKADQVYVVGPIAIRSYCAHHLVPIHGQAWVGVIPDPDSLIGLSKHHRLLEWVFARPQIQEEATEQAADALEAAIGKPRGLAVVVRAKHLCCALRGVRDDNSLMTTSVMRGLFKTETSARAEFLSLIGGMNW